MIDAGKRIGGGLGAPLVAIGKIYNRKSIARVTVLADAPDLGSIVTPS